VSTDIRRYEVADDMGWRYYKVSLEGHLLTLEDAQDGEYTEWSDDPGFQPTPNTQFVQHRGRTFYLFRIPT
jgi:hypothetical protein